jgi:RimJ/RimL family protein N-acetyltransferase
MKYLIFKFEEEKKKKKVEYGIYLDNLYIGNISIFDLNEKSKSGEIGYWLVSNQTRKGYVTEAVKVLEKEFFENHDLNRIQIKCDERNEASFGVAKKCGYIFEGKYRQDNYSQYFKDFRNTLVYSKLKSEYQ